jgi:hypothetical protein
MLACHRLERKDPGSAREIRAMLIALLCLAFVACDDRVSDGDGPLFIVLDAAGDTVADDPDRGWTDVERLRLSAEPVLRIGGMSDRHAALYGFVDAVVLADGTVVISHAGGEELLFMDAAGDTVALLDRVGSGPGEFRSAGELAAVGDSVFVYDSRQRRLLVFRSDGTHVRDVGIEGETGLAEFVGVVGGRYIFAREGAPIGSTDSDALFHRPATYLGYDTTGARVAEITAVRGRAYFSVPSARISEAAVPFTPRLMAAIGGERLFVGDGGEREIRSYSTNGDLERALRSARAPVPVTQEDIDRRTAHLDSLDGGRAGEFARNAPWPDAHPAFTQILAEGDGRLWVCEGFGYAATLVSYESCWNVHDVDGMWLGKVHVPQDVAVWQVGRNFILGLRFDDVLPEVVVYRLASGPAA